MDENIAAFKYIDTPYIKRKNKFIDLFGDKMNNNRFINTAKLSKKSRKYKNYFFDKKKLILNKTSYNHKFLQKRNSQSLLNIRKGKLNSAIIIHPKKSRKSSFLSPLNITSRFSKITNTKYSSFSENITPKIKRNYSSYYVSSKLNLSNNKYISDLLNSVKKNSLNKNQKISDIEKKITILGKTLNIQSASKCNSSYNLSPKKKENENKKNDKEKRLPDFLKEEFRIKGTNILSPFCKKSRDNFILQKFKKFLNLKKTLKTDKKNLIDNKLNIVYAENEEIYRNKLKKINNELVKQGKRARYKYLFSPSEKQLRDLEKRVTFMKDIVEFGFPNTTMMKLRKNKQYKNKSKINYKKFESMNDKVSDDHKNDFYEIRFN